MKIYDFPFAITLESSLSIADFELLQKHDPRALALRDISPSGEETEFFRMGYINTEFGTVTSRNITFVGETKNKLAGVSILIPANLNADKKAEYIDNKLADVCRNVAIIEANAVKAIEAVKAAQKSFSESIITLELKEAKK